jgi:Uma2 family endonuclease
MTIATQILTADDLLSLPGDRRCELIAGEIVDMPPPGFQHGRIINRISNILTNFSEPRRLGIVLGAETGFRLRRNPDTVRGIDIAFVKQERIGDPNNPRYFEGAPDLAVEVLSPSDTVTMMDHKVADLLDAGATAVWVVNPDRRTVTVYNAGRQPVVFTADQTIDAGDAVPGFSSAVSAFF